jgi:hypothetical protein
MPLKRPKSSNKAGLWALAWTPFFSTCGFSASLLTLLGQALPMQPSTNQNLATGQGRRQAKQGAYYRRKNWQGFEGKLSRYGHLEQKLINGSGCPSRHKVWWPPQLYLLWFPQLCQWHEQEGLQRPWQQNKLFGPPWQMTPIPRKSWAVLAHESFRQKRAVLIIGSW